MMTVLLELHTLQLHKINHDSCFIEPIISQLPIMLAVSLMLLAAYAGIIAWSLSTN